MFSLMLLNLPLSLSDLKYLLSALPYFVQYISTLLCKVATFVVLQIVSWDESFNLGVETEKEIHLI